MEAQNNELKLCSIDIVKKIASFLTVGELGLFTRYSKRLNGLTQDVLRIYRLRELMLTIKPKALSNNTYENRIKEYDAQKAIYDKAHCDVKRILESYPHLATKSPMILTSDDLHHEPISTFQWSLRMRVPEMQLLLLDAIEQTTKTKQIAQQRLHTTFLIHLLNNDTTTVSEMLKNNPELKSIPLKMGNVAGEQYEGMSAFKVALRHTCIEVAEVILEQLKPTLTKEQQVHADLYIAVMRDQHNNVNAIMENSPALVIKPWVIGGPTEEEKGKEEAKSTNNEFEHYSPLQLAAYTFNTPMVSSMMKAIEEMKEKARVEAEQQLMKMSDFWDWRTATVYQAFFDKVHQQGDQFTGDSRTLFLARHLGAAKNKEPMWLQKLMNKEGHEEDRPCRKVSTSAIAEEVIFRSWWNDLGRFDYWVFRDRAHLPIVVVGGAYVSGFSEHDHTYVTELGSKRICEMRDYCPQLLPPEELGSSNHVLGQ